MTPPFPPLPPAAPQIVQDRFNIACQRYEREQVARNMLDTLALDVDPALRKRYQEDHAFAQYEVNNAHALYVMALEDAGYPADEDTPMEKAS